MPLLPDWENVKLEPMAKVVLAKFEQHPDLARRLAAIEGSIVEENTWATGTGVFAVA